MVFRILRVIDTELPMLKYRNLSVLAGIIAACLPGILFGQLSPVTDANVPCMKVIRFDGNHALGVNFTDNYYSDIICFDLNSGEVTRAIEGMIYAYAEQGDAVYFFMRNPENAATTALLGWRNGNLEVLDTYSGVCRDFWSFPSLNLVVGSSPGALVVIQNGMLNPEISLGARTLNFLKVNDTFTAITDDSIHVFTTSLEQLNSIALPNGWKSFNGAAYNGNFLLTDSIPYGYKDRMLAIFDQGSGNVIPVTNEQGEANPLPSYLLPSGMIGGQILLSGNGHFQNDNFRIVNPTGAGLIDPNTGIFTDLSAGPEIYTYRIQPILKHTNNGPVLFGRMDLAGIEPYKLSTGGLKVLKDIYPGYGSSMDFTGYLNIIPSLLPVNYLNPLDILEHDGVLFFSAISPGLGHQIWRTDGTAEGTQAITNYAPTTKGFKHAFFSEMNGEVYATITQRNKMSVLYKLDVQASPVEPSLPDEKNWEIMYTKNPTQLSGLVSMELQQYSPLVADDGSIVIDLKGTEVYEELFAINQRWVLPGKLINGYYRNSVVQYIQPDGGLKATAVIRYSELERFLTGRNPDNGHVYVLLSHYSGYSSIDDVFVNETRIHRRGRGHFLIELNQNGELVTWKFIPTGGKNKIDLNQIKVDATGIYVMGLAANGFAMEGVEAVSIGENLHRTYAFKFDSNLNLAWSQSLKHDQYLFGSGLNTLELDNGQVYLSSGGTAYNVSGSCAYSDWEYLIAALNKNSGNLKWEQICNSTDFIRITDIKALPNDQLWFGGYTRGDLSIGLRSLKKQENYRSCGNNGFLLCMSKAEGDVLLLKADDPGREKLVQNIEYKNDLLYVLSLVYEEETFPVPIYGYDGHYSIQLDRRNLGGILIDSLRWPTMLTSLYYSELINSKKLGMSAHPDGGMIFTGFGFWNGSIDGFSAMPNQSKNQRNTWLVQRRSDLNFLQAPHVDSNEEMLTIYPNPVNLDAISVSIDAGSLGQYQRLSIYDAAGRLIMDKPFRSEFKDHIIYLDRAMTNGIYLLKVSGTGGQHTGRFMLLR